MPSAPESCPRCAAPLAPGDAVCRQCQALVHGARLEQLCATAQSQEGAQEYEKARDTWFEALGLLPADSSQAGWVRANLNRVDGLARAAGAKSASAHPGWARRFGPLAPLLVLLAKGKFLLALLKLKSLLSLMAFAGYYWAIYGPKFGLGIAALVLVHELGHFVEVKRQGLPAELPVFIPGFGAYVRWQASGVSLETRALVSLAGPLAGALGAGICALVWKQSGDELFAGLAGFSALINLLNLIPVWALDGGQAFVAFGRTERILLACSAAMFAAVFSQPLFLLVAAGAAYRCFTHDLPEQSHPSLAMYYAALLASLGYLEAMAPHHLAR
jgi:Zn-dependent protease